MLRPSLVIVALLLVAPAAQAAASVRTMGGFFDPATLEVVVGEEITFVNEDSMPHTVTSTWDSGETFDVILRAGETFSHTFAEEGAFAIHCRPHAGMEMTVQVSDVEGTGSINVPLAKTPLPGLGLLVIGLVVATLVARRAQA